VREVWRIIPSEDRGNPGAIATAVRQKHNKIPLFLFNEIDGLVVNDPDFVGTWRSLSDTGQARFLMVGYSAISRLSVLNKPDSPFFHFTEGTNFGNKAIALTALSPSAAEQLLTLLETSELGLRWQNKEQREKAFQLLIEKSYRIPWVLQSYGKLLVEHLEKDRRDTLALDDVKMILKQEGRLVWQYINNIDYSTLGYHGKAKVGPGSFRLILFALARQHYFIGGEQAPIRDPRLRERPALAPGLGFTVAEVQEAVQNIIERLLLGREQTAFEQWFADLDLDQTLQLLTLTLALEPDPFQSDRYGFLLHIVPLELYQEYGEKDPTLDDCIVNEAISFIQSMRK
ncbi:MAG: hypothetical protein RKP20_01620, partial [Candidatus Competibacter sp.]|nr:hypothetical protein [Candidatus Competibacter sp.]